MQKKKKKILVKTILVCVWAFLTRPMTNVRGVLSAREERAIRRHTEE
jgi:hypothetical protein